MTTTAQKARELLEDLAYENPPPEERWFGFSSFDPQHGRSEITYAKSKGFIEVDNDRMRLTEEGRRHLLRKKRSDAK